MYSDKVNDSLLHPWNSLNTYESIRDASGNLLWNFRHITATAFRSLSRNVTPGTRVGPDNSRTQIPHYQALSRNPLLEDGQQEESISSTSGSIGGTDDYTLPTKPDGYTVSAASVHDTAESWITPGDSKRRIPLLM